MKTPLFGPPQNVVEALPNQGFGSAAWGKPAGTALKQKAVRFPGPPNPTNEQTKPKQNTN